MNKHIVTIFTILLVALGGTSTADAQEPHVVYDQHRGELSVGTQAPSRAALVETLRHGAPTTIMAMLEYGERVECHECVPLLEGHLLENDDARVREFAAWWLRRRPFAIGVIMRNMRVTLQEDASPVRRARAAEAIGEFLDPSGFPVLRDAAMGDVEAMVRSSAVRALGRLNHPAGNAILAAALSDDAAEVRRAAIDQVLKVNFFTEHEALIGALGDSDAEVRRRAALLVGELHVDAAAPALAGMLAGDADRDVRQAAAWALGKVGGAMARTALIEASDAEEDVFVRSAIEVALRMR